MGVVGGVTGGVTGGMGAGVVELSFLQEKRQMSIIKGIIFFIAKVSLCLDCIKTKGLMLFFTLQNFQLLYPFSANE